MSVSTHSACALLRTLRLLCAVVIVRPVKHRRKYSPGGTHYVRVMGRLRGIDPPFSRHCLTPPPQMHACAVIHIDQGCFYVLPWCQHICPFYYKYNSRYRHQNKEIESCVQTRDVAVSWYIHMSAYHHHHTQLIFKIHYSPYTGVSQWIHTNHTLVMRLHYMKSFMVCMIWCLFCHPIINRSYI